MKALIIFIVCLCLSGCVSYTNSKGQKCKYSLDPFTNLLSLAVKPMTGVNPANQCEENPKSEE